MKHALALLCAALIVLCLSAAPRPAQALVLGSETCTATVSALNFGNVSPIHGTTAATTATVTVTCTWNSLLSLGGAEACVGLNQAQPLALSDGSSTLLYDLYTDPGHTHLWGTLTGNAAIQINVPVAAILNATTRGTATVYAQLVSGQTTTPLLGGTSTTYSQLLSGGATQFAFATWGLLSSAPACSAQASMDTFQLNSQATVINDCTISAADITFPASGLLNTALTAVGAITTQCTSGDAYSIALNGGLHGSVGARQMGGGTGTVAYQLYSDSGYSQAWGDGTSGTSTVAGTGTGQNLVTPVYARVPAQATPAPGTYTDTITATITY